MLSDNKIIKYIKSDNIEPLFEHGDCCSVLKTIPDNTIDCIVTSPPYWGQRAYSSGGLGLEEKPEQFIDDLLAIIIELKRVLKASGSFWLNLGDKYSNKALQGIPWRVALRMIDEQNWILRDSVIWHKHKGGLQSNTDRLRNVHENIFHFVKKAKGYYFNSDNIRSAPRKAIVKNGSVISATGVSGIRYRRQIELSTSLSEDEKKNANKALDDVLQRIVNGEIADFRMIIRNQQRTTHSDSLQVSGRAKQLNLTGFYFMYYHPNGSVPGDVWDIVPEDTQKREKHYAVYPEDLCRIPILATCPQNGIVLDPFCGTGTTNKVAYHFLRKSIGIDLSDEYLSIAKHRILPK